MEELRSQILNLHDAFINANFCRTLMERTPPEAPPDGSVFKWTITDRARLERLWWAMTYVLIEAWDKKSSVCREFFNDVDGVKVLNLKLRDLRKNGVMDKLRECRHYMCHRDQRAYWDEGRMAPVGHLEELRQLSRTFGAVFLNALKRIRGLQNVPENEEPEAPEGVHCHEGEGLRSYSLEESKQTPRS